MTVNLFLKINVL